jgi:3-isopropylmalate dehydrogenase
MRFRLAVLPGDGIGPEVLGEAVKVLRAVEAASNGAHSFQLADDVVGGAAIDAFGTPLSGALRGRRRTQVG